VAQPAAPVQAPNDKEEILPMPTPERVEVKHVESLKKTKVIFLRRNLATEEELGRQLASAETVGLGKAGSRIFQTYSKHIKDSVSRSGSKGAADADPIFRLRRPLSQLPMRDGPASALQPRAAAELETLSRKLRTYLTALAPEGQDGQRFTEALRVRLRDDIRGEKPEWLRAEAVPTLTQMLMAEDAPTRRMLVELLTAIPEKPATIALAQRAVFDLDAGVRASAVGALKGRDPEVWRPVLIKALSYPWVPPADFAAEALGHLKDRGAIAELVTLLKKPQPGRPFATADRRLVIQEVVKIQHEKNCMLCHVPAIASNARVLGVDPTWPVPVSFATSNLALVKTMSQLGARVVRRPEYSKNGEVTISTTEFNNLRVPVITAPVPALVRADITFLRQDFSVSFPVTTLARNDPKLQQLAQVNPAVRRLTNPPPVRFDYVVRTRPVDGTEWKRWKSLGDQGNPQRDAVLHALRRVTGQQLDDTTEAWMRAYSLAEPEVRSIQLANRLVRAEAVDRGALLLKHRDGAGIEHTWALARAIPRLSGPSQELARQTLVTRLGKESVDRLRERFQDPLVEVRRAAVEVAVHRNDLNLATDLIALLDQDQATARVAREALRKLTGQDLPDAASWRKWWTSFVRTDEF
jgi:hypothetical protein